MCACCTLRPPISKLLKMYLILSCGLFGCLFHEGSRKICLNVCNFRIFKLKMISSNWFDSLMENLRLKSCVPVGRIHKITLQLNLLGTLNFQCLGQVQWLAKSVIWLLYPYKIFCFLNNWKDNYHQNFVNRIISRLKKIIFQNLSLKLCV